MFSKESMHSKLISNDPKFFFKIHGGDLGRITSHTCIIEVGNFIGFKFWGYSFVFLISCLFCFCFWIYFVLVFYLGLRSLFVFLCVFVLMLICLHMLLSWVHWPLYALSKYKGSLAKITLLMEGSACLIKKKVYG